MDKTKSENAQFDLFDSSTDALAECSAIARARDSADRIRTIKGDLFSDLDDLEKSTYDIIFVGNTTEYIPNPSEYIAEHILPLLMPGGILAIRDLDCRYMSCSLADRDLNARVVNSRIQNNIANSHKDVSNYQNPFIGSDLEQIMRRSGLEIFSVYPFFISFNGPIGSPQREYLEALHQNWYIEDTLGILSKDDKEQWSKLFNSSLPGNIFDNPNTKYVEAEFLVIGRRK